MADSPGRLPTGLPTDGLTLVVSIVAQEDEIGNTRPCIWCQDLVRMRMVDALSSMSS